jgi:hypothetical protein
VKEIPMPIFGRLEAVEIRSGWPREDFDFTPWLAKPEIKDIVIYE